MKAQNPYANPNGSPKPGKEPEFFEWSRNEELKRISTLSKSNQNSTNNSQKELALRMKS